MLSRIDTARLATYNPGFDTKPHNIDYRSKGTLENLPLGYDAQSDAQDIHHVLGLQEHLRQFVENLTPEGQIQVLNRFLSLGIPVPQDPRNLIAVNKKPHNLIHSTQKEMGLESNNELVKKQLQSQIAQLPLDQRLIAVDTFAEHIYPAIIENLHSLGIKVPTQAENVRAYNQSIEQEAATERKLHVLEQMKDMYGEKPTIENIRKVMEPTRYAGEKVLQAFEAGRDAQSTGAVSGQSPLVVNAGEGSRVYVHTNGNENGHAEMQKAFNKSNSKKY